MVAPTITINGQDIAPRFIRSTRHVARANVRIEWGRETLFDEPVPGVATITIMNIGIDPPAHQKGDRVLIRHPEHGYLFRGQIAETDTTSDYITHANGLRERISETVIVAHDPMAALKQTILTGPSAGRPSWGTSGGWSEGVGGWHDNSITQRMREIATAGADAFAEVSDIATIVQSSPLVRAYIAPRKPDESSAAEVMFEPYAMRGVLSSFGYNAVTERFSVNDHADAEDAVITLRQTGIVLAVETFERVPVLPADRILIDETKLVAPADDIATVRIEWFSYDTDESGDKTVLQSVEGVSSARVPGATSIGRTYLSPFKGWLFEFTTTADQIAGNRYPSWWLAQAQQLFATINGTSGIPQLTIDPEDEAFADLGEVDVSIPMPWRTYQTNNSFYLAGSMFAGMAGAPAVVQIIAGTLEYVDGRWSHTLTPAVTQGGAPAGLTLDQLFPASSADQLDAWDESLTINDLAAVNRRA